MTEEQTPDLPYYVLNLPKPNLINQGKTDQILVYTNGFVKIGAFVIDLRKTIELRKDIARFCIERLKGERCNLTRCFYSAILDIMSSCQSPLSKTSCVNSVSTSDEPEKASM